MNNQQDQDQSKEDKEERDMSKSQAESQESGNERGREVLEDPECPQEVKDAYVEGQRGS
jgi:hypothetical protein